MIDLVDAHVSGSLVADALVSRGVIKIALVVGAFVTSAQVADSLVVGALCFPSVKKWGNRGLFLKFGKRYTLNYDEGWFDRLRHQISLKRQTC